MDTGFNNLKVGQKLLKRGRRSTGIGVHSMTEWVEVFVEKVTKVSYFVDGEKYSKNKEGKEFFVRFYFPGQEDAPMEGTPEGDFDKFMEKVIKIKQLDHISPRLDRIKDLDKAAEFADKLSNILEEVAAELEK